MVRPHLTERLNQSFPDPSHFKEEREFFYAAAMASTFKKVIAELISYVDGQVEQAKFLEDKKQGKLKNSFKIGGE